MGIDWVKLNALAGTLLSVLGLLVAGLQTVRLRQLRRRSNADVWLSIRTTGSIIRKLDSAPSYKSDSKVAEAYGKIVELYRHLIKQAVLNETRFSETTIKKWRSVGKLNTDWQEEQARQFLDTESIDAPRSEPKLSPERRE